MRLVEQGAVMRGLIRADHGEDIVDALAALASAAGWSDGFVTGTGQLAMVELRSAAAAEGITLDSAELVSLSGRIRQRDGRAEVSLYATVLAGGAHHDGEIVSALAGNVLLVVDAVSPSTQPVRGEATVGGSAAAAPAAAAPAPPRPPPVAARPEPPSQTFTARPIPKRVPSPRVEEEENPIVEAGERLEHPQLGLCVVVGDDDSGGTKIRVPSGRIRVLRLDALQVLPGQPDAEGRMVYRVVGPRRRR